MLHTSAIVLHATCAVAAFVVGVILIFQPAGRRRLQLARALVALLALMGLFLLVAILSHLTSLPAIQQFIFGGLFLLLLYMVYRAVQAVNVLTRPSGGQGDDQLKVVDHVGFVLISLFDGFAIVSTLDLGAPGWLVAIIAVGAVVVGILALNARKTALKMQTA
jgi:Ca2+/Na+ antiporter